MIVTARSLGRFLALIEKIAKTQLFDQIDLKADKTLSNTCARLKLLFETYITRVHPDYIPRLRVLSDLFLQETSQEALSEKWESYPMHEFDFVHARIHLDMEIASEWLTPSQAAELTGLPRRTIISRLKSKSNPLGGLKVRESPRLTVWKIYPPALRVWSRAKPGPKGP